jgi:Alg9-like mannosyltransferase family
MQWTTIICAICVRVLVALFTRTYFQPDEYFQSLEPAHVLVFGYGHLTWEWLAVHPIRSAVYPALNVPIYWILKVTKLGDIWPSLLVRICNATDASYILHTYPFLLDRGPKNSAWRTRCHDGCVGMRTHSKSDRRKIRVNYSES